MSVEIHKGLTDTLTWRSGHFAFVLKNDFSVKREARKHVLFKHCDILGIQAKVVVFLEERLSGRHCVFAGHDVPKTVIICMAQDLYMMA